MRIRQQDIDYPVDSFKLKNFKNILELSDFTEQEKTAIKRYAPWHTVYVYVSDKFPNVHYKIHPFTYRNKNDIEFETDYSDKQLAYDLEYLSQWKDMSTKEVTLEELFA